LVIKLSKPGSELTQEELIQFEKLTEQFGGKLRYDLNPVKEKILKPHVQVEASVHLLRQDIYGEPYKTLSAMEQNLILQFLTSFLLLFEAKIENYKIVEDKILGTVGWINEEDKQDFAWTIRRDISYLYVTSKLCNFLYNNKLLRGDHIIITEDELQFKLRNSGWEEGSAKEAIEYLCSTEVKMVDDGEETDSFFIHF
jgi:hypothetical protein